MHPDDFLTVAPLPRQGGPDTAEHATVRLPVAYVAEHVELGYATTIHRTQGMTVDHAHVLVHPGMTRQALYVALTRGRASNHAYVAVDAIDPTCPHPLIRGSGDLSTKSLIDARVDELLRRPDNTWVEATGPPPSDPDRRGE